MHYWSWGADDCLYVVSCDGSNFGHPWARGALLKIKGTPPGHKVEQVSDFPGFEISDHNEQRRYPSGVLAVDNMLYVSVAEYVSDGHILFWPHYGVVAIMASDDGGQTWINIPDKDSTSRFLGPRYAAIQFVGFGPGYTQVPAALGDHVYGISNDDNWESGNHVFLARAPRDNITDRKNWEFCTGGDSWVAHEDMATPIFSDPGHVSHPDMVYNPVLKRYFLSIFSDCVVHSPATPNDTARKLWDKQTELQIYESPDIWGPWFLVYSESPWEGPDHAPYCPRMPGKWISEDGLSGTMIFSGDWMTTKEYYGLVTRSFRMIPITHPHATALPRHL